MQRKEPRGELKSIECCNRLDGQDLDINIHIEKKYENIEIERYNKDYKIPMICSNNENIVCIINTNDNWEKFLRKEFRVDENIINEIKKKNTEKIDAFYEF